MRNIALVVLAISVTACAPTHEGIFQSYSSAYGQQTGTYNGAYSKGTPQGISRYGQEQQSAQGQNSHYNSGSSYALHQASYTYDAPTSVYPVGCGQIDVSNCAYNDPNSHVHDAPKLRGRQGKKNTYASIGGGTFDLDRKIYTGVIRAGIDGGYLGLEVEGSKSFVSDKIDLSPTIEEKTDLDYSVAGFGVLRFPLGDRVRALGRFGYHFSKLDMNTTSTGVTVASSTKIDDIAYGGGLEFDVTPKDSLRFDYTAYESDIIGRADSLTGSYIKRF